MPVIEITYVLPPDFEMDVEYPGCCEDAAENFKGVGCNPLGSWLDVRLSVQAAVEVALD